MTHATEEMHHQLIAVTSTGVDRRKLNKDKLKLALEDPRLYDQRFAAFINAWEEPQPELPENITGHLRLISGAETLTLEPTDGKATIAKVTDIFTYLDGDFQNWGCDVEDLPTEERVVQVFEQIKDGTFTQIYGGMGVNLDAMCLSQGQIIQFFTRGMYKKYLIHENPDDAGYGYFRFLFKVGEEFFVADVHVSSDGRLEADVNRLSRDDVWYAEYHFRFVIPQLAAQVA